MIPLELICTRAEANQKQLLNCISTLETLAVSFKKTAQMLSIAGNEVRLKILFLLNIENELCPCDIADILKMSVPAISQHIRKIKDAGIITARREGQTLYYSLNEDKTDILFNIFSSIKLEKETA